MTILFCIAHGTDNEKTRLTSRPTRHPKIPARSPMIVVRRASIPRAQKNANQPPAIDGGGTMAKIIYKQ